ncbi:MAG TPA: lactonase family protein [Bryobacteraceae bacterium]|nr:lactonase family protein [Bryobacteraceae bacterium]
MHQDLSRRHLLKTASVSAWPLLLRAATSAPPRLLAYVGSYSSPQGPEGSKGNGKGIYVFTMDLATGSLTPQQLCEDGMNPSWLAFHPSAPYLYAANEVSNFNGRPTGAVTAYAIDAHSGSLTRLNTVSSEGAGPAHLSVHPSGKHVLVANYYGGTFAVLPLLPDARLQTATDVQHDTQPPGPIHAASAPPGSFAISGHDRPHAHMIESDPSGKFVLGTDLGTDTIHIWRLNQQAGKLEPIANVSVPPGDGPRHFVFHPNGRWLYSLQEEASTLILFDFDPAAGTLKARQQVSTLPPGFTGTNFTSEVRLSADGRFLYAANRLHDSIAVFSIGASGELTFVSETWTRGDYPRSFTIDPSANYLYCCNQRADAITCFRINRATGALTFTDRYTPVGTPSIIVFGRAVLAHEGS